MATAGTWSNKKQPKQKEKNHEGGGGGGEGGGGGGRGKEGGGGVEGKGAWRPAPREDTWEDSRDGSRREDGTGILKTKNAGPGTPPVTDERIRAL